MIIIRSQDGTRIFGTKDIELVQRCIWFNDICNDKNDISEVIVGTYKSKERAKEVMDEIQKHIEDQYILNIYCNLGVMDAGADSMQETMEAIENSFKKLSIYQMPEE